MFEFEIAGKRILEVGCGIGLASLVLNHRPGDITATDHHPQQRISCAATLNSTTATTSRFRAHRMGGRRQQPGPLRPDHQQRRIV